MKTTVQKRIPLKQNIVVDRITGELTLRHRLPFRWREYIPSFGYDEGTQASEEPVMQEQEQEELQDAEFVEKESDSSAASKQSK